MNRLEAERIIRAVEEFAGTGLGDVQALHGPLPREARPFPGAS
jgi:hypothetical protein